jgi:hypothetical protein
MDEAMTATAGRTSEKSEEALLDENEVSTAQELLNAVSALPGVWSQVSAFMRGRGIEDPDAEVEALRKQVF